MRDQESHAVPYVRFEKRGHPGKFCARVFRRSKKESAVFVIIFAAYLPWARLRCGELTRSGQIAQLVERSPEKAGVGGSIPSLATILSITYALVRNHIGSTWFQNFALARRGFSQVTVAAG